MNIFWGIVEDRSSDPIRICRYKVRVIGVHSPLTSELLTEDLPWAVPIQNDSAAMSGIGKSANGYLQGSTVAVIFMDEDLQVPLILGSIAGYPGTQDYTGSEMFDSVNSDLSIIPPDAPLADIPGTTYTPPSEANYIGKLTKTDVRKLIPHLKDLRAGQMELGIGEYQHTNTELYRLGYVDVDGVWLGLNGITSSAQYENDSGLQYDAQENLFKLNYVQLIKNGSLTTDSPKEKTAGLLLAAQVLGPHAVFTLIEDGIDTFNSVGETCFQFYKNGYKVVSGRSTVERPNRNNISAEASDKYETDVSTSKSEYDVKATDKTNKNHGFMDPSGVYPLADHNNEPDTPRLASGLKINETIVGFKETVLVKDITVANSTIRWSQSPIPYNAVYPHNKVYQSPSGHVMEFDDTPGSERINLHHRSGTFWEVDNKGNSVDRVMSTRTIIVDKDELVYIRGSGHVSIDGDMSLRIGSALQIEVIGDANIRVNGNLNHTVVGDYSLDVAGKLSIKGSMIDIDGEASLGLKSASLAFSSPTIVPGPGVLAPCIAFAQTQVYSPLVVQPAGDYSPTITLPSPVTRKELQAIELEDTTSTRTLANESAHAAPKIMREDRTSPTKSIIEVKSINEMSDDITYQTRLSANYTVRNVSVGNLGSNFPFGGQHGLTARHIAENLRSLCMNCLEPINTKYSQLGFKLNSVIRPAGNPNSISGKISQHELGQAADISFSGIRGRANDREQFYDVALWIKDNIMFDQMLLEYRDEGRHVWIHLSFKTDNNRRQILTLNNDRVIKEGLVELA